MWAGELQSLGPSSSTVLPFINRISPNLDSIPNWKLLGDPIQPEILSNKVILTPPAVGNQRGAAWSEKTLDHTEWTTDVDFRASGPERGNGNLQIWFTKDGLAQVGSSSLYTAGKFDGLALVIDTYGGTVSSHTDSYVESIADIARVVQ
jgi:mannose-binding lectin 1